MTQHLYPDANPSPEQDKGRDAALHLHAELLPNIRQVTLYISLPDTLRLKDRIPEIHLSESRRAVTVFYPGDDGDDDELSETIKLPARVSETARIALKRRAEGESVQGWREVSYRMPIDASEELSSAEVEAGFVPWTASDMTPTAKVQCRECGDVILDSPTSSNTTVPSEGHGWIWKDLPSGNWAEMMDFWHCHKPDPPKDEHGSGHGQHANGRTAEDPISQVKGYGAANRVVAVPGTVLVDVASFLVSEVDCLGLKKVDTKNPRTVQAASIACSKCDSLIGVEDIPSSGWRLLKANIAVNTQAEDKQSTWETHPIETIVASQLLELVERESARRVVVHFGVKSGLLLWIFNPNLRYSNCNAEQSITAQGAIKVFFQGVSDIDALLGSEQGNVTPLSVEELEVPRTIFEAILSTLLQRNLRLPVSATWFREWRVGLLHRFERGKGR